MFFVSKNRQKIFSTTVFYSIIFFAASLHAEILSTNDFTPIEEECKKLDSSGLVLFDVDATLIVPDDAILKPKGKELFKQLVANWVCCITPVEETPKLPEGWGSGGFSRLPIQAA